MKSNSLPRNHTFQRWLDRGLTYSVYLDAILVICTTLVIALWFVHPSVYNGFSTPVISGFTAFSLFLLAGTRLASHTLETWSKPMTLAITGIVAAGNFSSLWIQLFVPYLFFQTFPHLVATSAMTSIGLILFCFYEILVTIRKTPRSAFIVDDILLHLALFPGGLSLLGHVLGVHAYQGVGADPRTGVGYLEMLLMGVYALSATIANRNLFLWEFLAGSVLNRASFLLLFLNQYLAPIAIGVFFRPISLNSAQWGIEFFVMLAGVLATLAFLVTQAMQHHSDAHA